MKIKYFDEGRKVNVWLNLWNWSFEYRSWRKSAMLGVPSVPYIRPPCCPNETLPLGPLGASISVPLAPWVGSRSSFPLPFQCSRRPPRSEADPFVQCPRLSRWMLQSTPALAVAEVELSRRRLRSIAIHRYIGTWRECAFSLLSFGILDFFIVTGVCGCLGQVERSFSIYFACIQLLLPSLLHVLYITQQLLVYLSSLPSLYPAHFWTRLGICLSISVWALGR